MTYRRIIKTGAFLIALAGVCVATSFAQTTLFWRDTPDTSNWENGQNWSLTSAAGAAAGVFPTDLDTVRFEQTSGTISTDMDLSLDAGPSGGLHSVQFGGTAASTFVVNIFKPLILNNTAGSLDQINLSSNAQVTFSFDDFRNIVLNSDSTFAMNGSAGSLTLTDAGNSPSKLDLGSNGLTLNLNGTANRMLIDVIINGTGTSSVTVNSASANNIVTLTKANIFTGATTVNGGVLNLLGSLNSSAVTVNSGGSLAGTGSVASLVLNGQIAPGNALNPAGAATSIATLTVNGNASINAGSTYAWQLGNATGGVPGTSWDLITVTGTLSVAGAGTKTITIDNLDGSWTYTQGRAYKIIGTSSAVSQATADLFTLAFGPNGSAAWGNNPLSNFYLEGRADGLYLVEIPEAGWYAAAAFGMIALAVFKRRRESASLA